MRLEPGLTFRVAPRFHLDAAWAARLSLNGGIRRNADMLLPRDDWREPTEDELEILVAGESAPSVGVFGLPAQLRHRWWELDPSDGTLAGYEEFVADVSEFLMFKRLPVPAHCTAAVVVSRPDQRSMRLDHSGAKLRGFGYAAAALGVINLGDERTHVVLLNLGIDALRAATGARDREADNVLAAFVAQQPEYPLVRVRLAPGEGLWFPSPPPAFDGWTVGKEDLDAVLVLNAAVQ